MKSKLPLILVLGGLIIAAIVWFGNKSVNQKSDVEYIQEGLMAQREAAESEAQTKRELSATVLKAPNICRDIRAGIFFEVVDTEPDSGDWPDWRQIASPDEVKCIMAAFHRTNAHAFKIQGKDYDRKRPSANQAANFISDVAVATLDTDGIDYGDVDGSAFVLINGYFAARAKSSFQPGNEY